MYLLKINLSPSSYCVLWHGCSAVRPLEDTSQSQVTPKKQKSQTFLTITKMDRVDAIIKQDIDIGMIDYERLTMYQWTVKQFNL